MAVEYDLLWDLDIEEDGADLKKSSLVRMYLDRTTSYSKTWWLDMKESDWNKQLMYRIEENVDVSGKCAENIELEKILPGGSAKEEEEELMTLIADKVLSPLEPVVSRDGLKDLASVLVKGCRDRLILLINDNPNSNSKLFSIGVAVRIQLSVTLLLGAPTPYQDFLLQPEEEVFDPSSPMPLPIVVPDGYDFFQLGVGAKEDEGKTCAICFGKYEPQCLMIRLQCMDELLPNPKKQESHKEAISLPCYHIFHAKCIAGWFKVPGYHSKHPETGYITCPLCRFGIPSRIYVLSLLHRFPLKLMRVEHLRMNVK
ncbi:unnamed protein product [Cuscuta epithymum]|uniref:RING-type domain-containing protein n=1 Tax=Cuscuta epithymum TaxID=186058 RepID=A0AAV0DFC8_9ASTE|nr:unnamed protein product [Cuscuta epithymum]